MVIDSFYIEGICNIEKIKLNVGQLNALIAPNGYGKSNVLSAIEFGITFLAASEQVKQQMMRSRFMPLNKQISQKDFCFEVCGTLYPGETTGQELQFQYGYCFAWAHDDSTGSILSEWLKVKHKADQRYKLILNRKSTDDCLIVPSATGRCTKQYSVSSTQLALSTIANYAVSA